ncbi:beta-lactamase-like protein 2 homolog [Aphis gossypii]|uniref:beta-lactamase-like protein 2 homolog n=1 Tax=Aphis gossypii TaxID=80765 RepID=UPI002159348B|nr:beta-lactamase-like protein 2 homolog [Aphis gossypii]XP_027849691.2 beta-lactamase-like protein 2 homolog [Aphis gossypii]XP_050062550.1 beta-lactamase-like protein 2 homolog [Aphis gossypii]XP_050062551.1 beta-lactamase-like protein 2 homolog [Aphis gossypii]
MFTITRSFRWRLPVSVLSFVHHHSHPSTQSIISRASSSKPRARSRMSLPRLPIVSSVSIRELRVLGCNPGFMTLQGTNTYVVGTGERRILIDAGEPNFPEYIKNLQETMMKYNFQLDHIIISHWHSDHIGGVNNVLDMITNKNECKVWKFDPKIGKKRDFNFPLHIVEDKQKFQVEGATLVIHHTPGHTTDHIVIFLEEDNALFSADSVLGEGTTVFEDLTEYLKSLQLILDLNPTTIFPGHGSVIKDPIVRVNNYIKHRLEREMELYNLINKSPSGSLSEDDIVNEMYKVIPNDYKKVALYIVKNHLAKLARDGKVVLIEDKWRIKK